MRCITLGGITVRSRRSMSRRRLRGLISRMAWVASQGGRPLPLNHARICCFEIVPCPGGLRRAVIQSRTGRVSASSATLVNDARWPRKKRLVVRSR